MILRCTTALIGSGAFVCACAQTYDGTTAPIDTSDCRAITGQADIDGTMQQVVGRACLQSDGTWRLVQNPDGSVPWYPLAAYPYPDPWCSSSARARPSSSSTASTTSIGSIAFIR
ncbi:hypothetical protein Y026_1045 [Burkholderia pseudomallei TSV28]|nr:hypothetical protein Y026_1045 [Burkholderia pseudomallei TSV28]